MSLGVQIFCLFLLVAVGGFFSFAEISLAAARKLRLRAMAEEKVRGAARTLKTKENPGRYFSVIQIGNNMAAIMGGIVGESAFSPYFAAVFRYFLEPQTAAQLGFVCSFLLITCAVVLLSDLLPKRLAINNPERNAILVSVPMRLIGTALAPFVWVFDNVANAALRLLNIPLAPKDKLTSDDILATVSAGGDQGIIAPTEQAVIENVFNMENRPVTTAMTARESIVYFTIDGDIDHVIGFIDSKDVLRRLLEGKPISITEQGLVQQVQFVPDTLTLSELLEMFQRSRGDFAVVLNEYALVVGIVTLRDVMSTVMGELVLTPEESQIIERDDHSWLVDGATPTVDLVYTLDLDELPDSQNYETVAGFMMYMLRKIPKRTDRFNWSGYRFEVIDVDANKIDQVLVSRISDADKKRPAP